MKNNYKDYHQYLLIGSPNVGKSTYYNKVTWKVSPVGNVDRVTTCALSAKLRNDKLTKIIDLPGIVSLNSISEDEMEAFHYVFENRYDGVINIIGANTLKRDLMLTYELAEAGILSMIQINMIDEIKNFKINKLALTNEFKVIVNEISAKKNLNVKNSLQPIINRSIKQPKQFIINYSDKIENFIKTFSELIPNNRMNKRFIITQALFGNEIILHWFNEMGIDNKFNELVAIKKINEDDIDSIRIAKQKLIDKLLKKLIVIEKDVELEKQNFVKHSKFQNIMDKIFLNKYWSIPIFILIIAFIWFVTFYQYTGGWLQTKLAEDGLGQLQTIISDAIKNINPNSVSQAWWSEFVGTGILNGIFTVVSFIPWILILMFLMSILEQIGIISRMCIVFDRLFNKFGISGRSIINLILGVGCNIPSMVISKNSNSLKEKVITILIMPFVSCSARVIVYSFIATTFVNGQFVWLFNLGLTSVSIIFALFFGYFFSNTLFRKSNSFFISELSPYRTPDFYVVIKKMLLECYDFLKRVILIIGVCNLIVWLLSYTGPDGIILNVDPNANAIEKSFLRYLSIPFQYLMYPTGIGQHWQLTISLITAFPAKEIAATNIETIFNGINGLTTFLNTVRLPISTMLSFLTFFTFYIPCMAAISVMIREIGKKYTLFNIITSIIGSWLISTIVFSISGLIESAIKFNTVSITSILISIMFIFTLIYLFNCIFKFMMFKKEKVWSVKQIKIHYLINFFNTCCLTSLIITSDVFLIAQ